MKLYTGYFAYTRKYIDAGLIPVSIALYTPRWFEGLEFKTVAPSNNLLNKYKKGLISEADFKIEYFSILDSRINLIKSFIYSIPTHRGMIFLCYERQRKLLKKINVFMFCFFRI